MNRLGEALGVGGEALGIGVVPVVGVVLVR